MQIFKHQGVDITYRLQGIGEPLALFNGVLMTMDAWQPQVDALQSQYQCILHDFRGQRFSPTTQQEIDLKEHVADFVALLDHLKISSCHVVGTSYGGEIALLLALTHPERVRSLVLIASVSEVQPLLHRLVQQWADCALSHPQSLYDVMLPTTYSDAFLTDHPELRSMGTTRLATYPDHFFTDFAKLVRAFQGLNVTCELKRITQPTLIMCGTEDRLKPPSYSALMAKQMAHAHYILIPGAGHAVIVEKPSTVNMTIRGFLNDIGNHKLA